ncbi:hypothetical protein O6H91_Y485900 [Diphasiastrum complanatum]|nr:hypothetical protein O6H91_Y485900 [Diphasiastrum complanatum]
MGTGVVTPMLWLGRCKQPPLNHHHPPSSSSSTTFITLLCCHYHYYRYSSLSCNFCLEGRVWRSRKRPRSRGLADDASASANENRGGDDGDGKVQDMLVNMVRLQAGEVQVNKFIDDRAKLLTDIAEGAKTEYGRIAEDAKRSIDEAGSKDRSIKF